ncbi:MAG TPA: SDR family NAD(P)-dependent oxidoreductase [Candidatus Dormibacteraeota bacterium]|nr:SDR family NAD(P)-dependent oxidoreductase [Candidatus Dormibacteraeota bacterium]
MSDPLAGGAVLVTGASSGIGRALATALVGRGARVIAAARSADRLASLAAELGPALEPVVADVAEPGDVQRLVVAAGRLDAVINNAGIGQVEPFLESDPAVWRATLDTNLIGALLVARAALPAMLAAGRGAVVNVGSASASGWPYLALYAASKAALHAASVALDREYAGRGVRVLHIEIGPTQGTEFGARSDPAHLPSAARAWTELGISWNVGVTNPAASAETILAALAAALPG